MMATWEITITWSRWIAASIFGGGEGEIMKAGQKIKARIEACHEQPKAGGGPALFQVMATEM